MTEQRLLHTINTPAKNANEPRGYFHIQCGFYRDEIWRRRPVPNPNPVRLLFGKNDDGEEHDDDDDKPVTR